MRHQPNRNYVSDDVVQTPPALARLLVHHFKPRGTVLEPCRGDGNIHRLLPKGSPWCEIKEGRDFYQWNERVDWILTNPPWSEIRNFLRHGMRVADHIVFLMTINHIWTKARLRDLDESGFGLKEIALLDMPASFPQSGFQLGAVYVRRKWRGKVTLTDFRMREEAPPIPGL